MKKEALKRIFDFLEGKENKIHKDKDKFIWKLNFNETLTKEELNVKGDLDLEFAKITSLPEGLKVSGFLSLRDTNITSLPEDLKVGGGLNLAFCDNITSLPESLYVDGDLNIRETPLQKYTDDELRDMVKPGFIKGEIYR